MSNVSRRWQAPGVDQWPQRGGAACLDFANSVAFRPTDCPYDGLREYDDLLAWSRQSGVLSAVDGDRLANVALQDEAGARAALESARSLRESIFTLFHSLASGQPADPDDLAAISAWRIDGMKRATLAMESGGFEFVMAPEVLTLTYPHWQVAESATRLLVSDGWRRVHCCPGEDCGWLFLDQTKNGNRRWCDSADCGNRARGRAFTRRQRQRQQTEFA